TIPQAFQEVLEPGMRVIIPFGPRKITGFVVARKASSSFTRLRDIIEVLDVTPVLTKELLQLGQWLANTTLSLYVTTYQAMLPQVLKAKYEKAIIRTGNAPLPLDLERAFSEREVLPFEEALALLSNFRELKRLIEDKQIGLHYIVTSRETKKYETILTPCAHPELAAFYEQLSTRAIRQKEIVRFFLDNHEPINQTKLYQLLEVNRGTIRPLLEKGILTEERVEVYRDPYERQVAMTDPLELLEEQKQALRP